MVDILYKNNMTTRHELFNTISRPGWFVRFSSPCDRLMFSIIADVPEIIGLCSGTCVVGIYRNDYGFKAILDQSSIDSLIISGYHELVIESKVIVDAHVSHRPHTTADRIATLEAEIAKLKGGLV